MTTPANLAATVTHPGSRWRAAIAAVPRHLFIPNWWDATDTGWTAAHGPDDHERWMRTAYGDDSIVTEVAGHHADHAEPGDHAIGLPTSSSTLPSLVLRMYAHGQLYEGADILDVGTGSGYGAALLTHRFGPQHVTTVDVDPYLTKAAAERFATIDLHPRVETVDATSDLPGTYDRIVAMVSMRPVPASWLTALRPGGRLVMVISGTSLILTATKLPEPDGPVVAEGHIEWDRAMFMTTRHHEGDYPPCTTHADGGEGEHVTTGRYPIVNVSESWDLRDMITLTNPGITIGSGTDGGRLVVTLTDDTGSWARAEAPPGEIPTVHQDGQQRLWDAVDDIRERWLTTGELPLRGSRAWITQTGTILIARGNWRTRVTR